MSRHVLLAAWLLGCASCDATMAPPPALELIVDAARGSFDLKLGAERWTGSGSSPRLHSDGKWLDLTMVALRSEDKSSGKTVFEYKVNGQGPVVLSTTYTTYPDNPSMVKFEQCVLVDLENAAVDASIAAASELVLSSFPSFSTHTEYGSSVLEKNDSIQDTARKGFFSYYNQMVGGMYDGTKYGEWGVDPIASGKNAGPVVVFNERSGTGAIAFAPFSNFMAQNVMYNTSSRALEFGLLGSISSVPAGTCSSVAAVAGWTPTLAVKALGSNLLSQYKKGSRQWDNDDVTIRRLSYSTDNGAYYYYNSGTFSSPQEAIETMLNNNTAGTQFGSVLLDSWWYFKGLGGGVKNWTATPSTFPNGGLPGFEKNVAVPIVAHNRFWSSDTVYAKANGGDYNFIIEPKNQKAIPLDQRFWNDLLSNATRDWGLAVYEQDWLHNEWEGLDSTLQNATLATTWLHQMGVGAAHAGVKIQYCMATPRFALASVMVPEVDQIRVSDDYRTALRGGSGHNANLYVGTSSLLAGALGLAPSKDVFWSTAFQPGSTKYGDNITAPCPELEAVVSVLTAGPVAVGDSYGYTNHSLIQMMIAKDGTLLTPDWPAVPVDDYFTQRAFGKGGPQGELTFSYTSVPVGPANNGISQTQGYWFSFLAIDLQKDYSLQVSTSIPSDLFIAADSYLVYRFLKDNTSLSASALDVSSSPLLVKACGQSDYGLYNLVAESPWPHVTVLGEVGKFVPMSSRRFKSVNPGLVKHENSEAGFVDISVVGVPGETIEVAYAGRTEKGGALKFNTASCTIAAGHTQCSMHGELLQTWSGNILV